MALGTNLFGRSRELLYERTGECFVGAVPGIEGEAENILGTACELPCGLGQPPSADKPHQRQSGARGKCPCKVKRRNLAGTRNVFERDGIARVTFNKPKCFLNGIHQTTSQMPERSLPELQDIWLDSSCCLHFQLPCNLPPSPASNSL